MNFKSILEALTFSKAAMALLIVLASIAIGYLLRRILFASLARWTKKTKTQVDDVIFSAVKGQFIVWFILLGLYFAVEFARLPQKLDNILDKNILVLVIVSVTFALANLAAKLIKLYSSKEVMREVNGGVAEFDPFIRYGAFADFSINFTVILRAREFVDQYLVKHEFIKRLHERYAKEGIIIPYPIRAINYEQEKSG